MAEDDELNREDRFYKANANNEYMAAVLADCIRNCMLGVASSGEPSSAAYKAAQDFLQLIKLMKHVENVPLTGLFSDAIDEIRPLRTDDIFKEPEHAASRYFDWTISHAAMTGIQFVVESSCHDNAAKGRASKRQSNFLDALRSIEDARKDMNADWEKRRAKDAAAGISSMDRARTTLAAMKATKKPRKPRKKD